jgi:hypothetical protein
MRNRLLLVAAALLAASSPSFGTIVCGATPTSISAIDAAGGCTNGTNTFTNVSIATSTESIGSSSDAIDPTKVQLAITGSGNLLNVILSDSDATSWALSGAEQFNLILTYTVTGGLPAYFTGVGDSLNASAISNANGTGTVSFDKTAGSVTLFTLSTGGMTSQSPVGFPGGPISRFDVIDNIQVRATNASATLVNAANTFTEAPNAPVPEPTTSLMLASGLLAFSHKLRRRRS